jgi:hypothetical protein
MEGSPASAAEWLRAQPQGRAIGGLTKLSKQNFLREFPSVGVQMPRTLRICNMDRSEQMSCRMRVAGQTLPRGMGQSGARTYPWEGMRTAFSGGRVGPAFSRADRIANPDGTRTSRCSCRWRRRHDHRPFGTRALYLAGSPTEADSVGDFFNPLHTAPTRVFGGKRPRCSERNRLGGKPLCHQFIACFGSCVARVRLQCDCVVAQRRKGSDAAHAGDRTGTLRGQMLAARECERGGSVSGKAP